MKWNRFVAVDLKLPKSVNALVLGRTIEQVETYDLISNVGSLQSGLQQYFAREIDRVAIAT